MSKDKSPDPFPGSPDPKSQPKPRAPRPPHTPAASVSVRPHADGSKLGTAGIGVTGGTLLVLVANNLPADSPLRPWLLGLAPTAAVALSWFAAWLKDSMDYWRDSRVLTNLIREAEAALTAAMNDPNYTEEEREAYRKDLEFLRRIAAERRMARARQIRDREPPPG